MQDSGHPEKWTEDPSAQLPPGLHPLMELILSPMWDLSWSHSPQTTWLLPHSHQRWPAAQIPAQHHKGGRNFGKQELEGSCQGAVRRGVEQRLLAGLPRMGAAVSPRKAQPAHRSWGLSHNADGKRKTGGC